MGDQPGGWRVEGGDAAYWRANDRKDEFVGLTVPQAIALAEQLELSLEILPADIWHAGVNTSGRVTVFVKDGLIRSAS